MLKIRSSLCTLVFAVLARTLFYGAPAASVGAVPDLELGVDATDKFPAIFSNFSVTFRLRNAGDAPASGVAVRLNLPVPQVVYQGGNEFSVSQGSFNLNTGVWQAGEMAAGKEATLTLHYFSLGTQEKIIFAQVIAQSPADADSSPDNNATTTPLEDDEAVISINAPTCKLSFQVLDVRCDNQNTTDPADDAFSADVIVQPDGPCGTAWVSSDGQTGVYGVALHVGPHLIRNGPVALGFNAAGRSDPPAPLTLLPPATCSVPEAGSFTFSQVRCGLSHPWEVACGPDKRLWVTESRAYRVTSIHPVTREQETVLDLSAARNFSTNQYPWPQGGLMGLAFHPLFNEGQPFVYLAYVYQLESCDPQTQGCRFKTKLARYQYNAQTRRLENETVLCDTIPGSDDHNGGRLAIGPAGNPHLFYSVGDMGAGQFSNANRPHRAQNPRFYEGKILRFLLSPDSDPVAGDTWIPNDNPFSTPQRQSAVWSYGHRNPQGLTFGDDGTLYEAEHGPYSDDEINLVLRGDNYGFPLVAGFADGNYNNAAVGTGTGLPYIADEAANAISLGPAYREPLGALFPAGNQAVRDIWNNVRANTPPFDNYFMSWPSVAPSGIQYYGKNGAIPGWRNSLLVASLKRARVYRLALSEDGQRIVGDTLAFFSGWGRFRDLALSPDGRTIYAVTDSTGLTSGPTQGTTLVPANKGCLLSFQYCKPAISVSAISCEDAGTPNQSGDDLFKVHLRLQTGSECGSQWLLNGKDTLTSNQQVAAGPFPIASGARLLVFTNVLFPDIADSVRVVPPLPCSVVSADALSVPLPRLYPNPVSHTLYIEASERTHRLRRVQFFDATGRVQAVQTPTGAAPSSLTVSTSHWPEGVYYVLYEFENGARRHDMVSVVRE